MSPARNASRAVLDGVVVMLFGFCMSWPPAAFASGGLGDAVADLSLERASEPMRLTIAGRPALLQVVRAFDRAEDVVTAAGHEWQRRGARVRRDDDGPWRSVSRIDRRGIEVLQMRNSAFGRSDGYLVVWHLEGNEERASPVPARSLAHGLLPPSAITLSDTASGGRLPGRTLVAWLPDRIDEADRTVLQAASALGLQQRVENRPSNLAGGERARFFSGAGSELALSLHREGTGTALVIHLMEAIR